jgi:hypothetical protein
MDKGPLKRAVKEEAWTWVMVLFVLGVWGVVKWLV